MRPFSQVISTVVLSALSVMSFAASNDLTGKWRTIDDRTGFSKAIIEISKDQNGIYSGKIVEILPRPGYTPLAKCVKCTGALKDQPVLGLQVLNNMHQSKTDHIFEGGTITDPNNGKTYRSKIILSEDGHRISLRGFIGFEKLGRNQTWLRAE